jgi:tetratricopeptide (TPR) repeat protein
MSILRSFTQKGQGKMTDNYRIFAICLCLILLSTTAIRAWASPSESQLGTIASQAQTDYQNGKYLQAISLLKQLLKIYPKDTSLLIDLASSEAELSNYTGSLYYYQKTLSIDPKDISAFVGMGLSLKHLGNKTEATKYFKEAITQPITSNDSRLLKVEQTEIAMALVYLGNYSQALDIANQILKQDTTDFGAMEIKAMSLIYMNKPADALTVLNTLVSEGHAVPWVMDDRGVCLLALGRYIGAIANFNATLKLEKNDAYALFNRAEAYLNLDFYSKYTPQSALEQLKHHKPLIFPHIDITLQDLDKALAINRFDKDVKDLKSLFIGGLKLGWLKQ